MTTHPIMQRSPRLRPIPPLLAALCVAVTAGCIIIPTPENILLEGRGVIEEAEGTVLIEGEARREDVVLRFGEPDLVIDEGRMLVYHWARASAWVLIGAYPGGAVMPLAKHHYLLLEFDPAGLLQRHEFLARLPDSLRGETAGRPFVAPADPKLIVVNPRPAWPEEAGLLAAGSAPTRLALGGFLSTDPGAAAPDSLGRLKSLSILIADVRTPGPATEFVGAAVAAQLLQAGHLLVAPEEAEILVSGEVAHFGVASVTRLSLSVDVFASLDVTLRFSCAGSSRELLVQRFHAAEQFGPIESLVTVAELQYVTTACLESLQRQLREDAGLAALLAAGPGACR